MTIPKEHIKSFIDIVDKKIDMLSDAIWASPYADNSSLQIGMDTLENLKLDLESELLWPSNTKN